jgi:excisionase family DNA binding protein
MNNLDLKEIIEIVKTNSKEVLTAEETASYMGVSKSYLYKLTMLRKIPHYKPLGKMCYFNRNEVEQWLQSNRVSTEQELNNG